MSANISCQQAAKVIAADFLRRLAEWASDHNHDPRKHSDFLKQAESFGVESSGMLLSQHWCDDLAKMYGVESVFISPATI